MPVHAATSCDQMFCALMTSDAPMAPAEVATPVTRPPASRVSPVTATPSRSVAPCLRAARANACSVR